MSSKSKKSKSPQSKNKSDKGAKELKDAMVMHDTKTHCLLCYKEFQDWYEVQAHLITMNHKTVKFNYPYFSCRICGLPVLKKTCHRHKCSFVKAHYIREIMRMKYLRYGPPNRCLLCNFAWAPSRVHLALHLICVHGQGIDNATTCNLCGDPFTNTNGIDAECSEIRDKHAAPNSKSKTKGSKSPTSGKKSPGKSANTPPKSPKTPPKSGKSGKSKGSGGKSDGEANYAAFQSSLDHIEAKHSKYFLLEAKKTNWTLANIRSPFSCPMCVTICDNNAEFHAHMLACHSYKCDLSNVLFECKKCDLNTTSMQHLAYHVKTNHIDTFQQLAHEGINQMLLQEGGDPSETCHVCWQYFKSGTELQMHLLSKHIGLNRLRCGLCLKSYSYAINMDLAATSFENHVKNHAIDHRSAARFLDLEFKDTDQPPWPTGLTKEEYCLCGLEEETAETTQVLAPKNQKKGNNKNESSSSNKANAKKTKA